jgi:hypothetical protein
MHHSSPLSKSFIDYVTQARRANRETLTGQMAKREDRGKDKGKEKLKAEGCREGM